MQNSFQLSCQASNLIKILLKPGFCYTLACSNFNYNRFRTLQLHFF